jgi:hypothetical protein
LLTLLEKMETAQQAQLSGLCAVLQVTDAAADSPPALDQLLPLLQSLLPLLADDDITSTGVAQRGEAALRPLLGTDYPIFIRHLESYDFPAALYLLRQRVALHPALQEALMPVPDDQTES